MTRIIILTATLLLSVAHAQQRPAMPIPAESTSPFDFRGKPSSGYAPYHAVYGAKTYGELRERLEGFFKAWETDKKSFDDYSSVNMYFHCKQGLLRACYLLGDTAAADQILMELDPVRPKVQEQTRAAAEQARMARIAKEIQVLHEELGLEDPFPKGPPEDVHALYAPLLKIVRDMGGE